MTEAQSKVKISISLDEDLVEHIDKTVEKNSAKRSTFINDSLRKLFGLSDA